MPCDGTGEYVTMAEAARTLGIGLATLERWARDGRIPSKVTQDGKRVLLSRGLLKITLTEEPPPRDH